MKNYLPKQYKKTTKLKINHNYLFEQFADYSKIFKEIEKVVKRGDYTLGQKVDEFEKNFAKRTGAKYLKYKRGDFPIAEKMANTTMSLPVHEFIKEKDIKYVANLINDFY